MRALTRYIEEEKQKKKENSAIVLFFIFLFPRENDRHLGKRRLSKTNGAENRNGGPFSRIATFTHLGKFGIHPSDLLSRKQKSFNLDHRRGKFISRWQDNRRRW